MFEHDTVLKEEAVNGLHIKPNGTYVDCTLGGAGHSELIVSHLEEDGCLVGIDQDEQALHYAAQVLDSYKPNVRLVKNNFRQIKQVLNDLDIERVDGFLYDLGVSSPQLDQAERGFSYQHDAPLDMRMNQDVSLTAEEIINEWSEEELAHIIYRYGEERFSRRIASRIVHKRVDSPIKTTWQLVDIIKASIPARFRREGPHPAKRTFQAIRIAVNDELKAFEDSLHAIIPFIAKGGRISVITFHSLEDRICKQFFRSHSQGCTCPPGFPQCVCGHTPELKIINKKPIIPNPEDIEYNRRARSSKLRIAEKL